MSSGATRRHSRRAHRDLPDHEHRRGRRVRLAGLGVVGLIATVLIALAVGYRATGSSAGVGSGGAGAAGSRAPSFSLADTVSGQRVTLRSLAGHRTLLFFSEGVTCQACMIQAADLQSSAALAHAGISLVSVTTDAPGVLAEAASQYGIRTPMLADPTTAMSAAYGMLAHGGMQHPREDGHAFMLLSPTGTVLWHRAYPQMYVAPGQLMADMRRAIG